MVIQMDVASTPASADTSGPYEVTASTSPCKQHTQVVVVAAIHKLSVRQLCIVDILLGHSMHMLHPSNTECERDKCLTNFLYRRIQFIRGVCHTKQATSLVDRHKFRQDATQLVHV